ncbi:MAG TPA: YihY/virulence factor BrkB family protein [Candidatus Tumulicola sp.]|nr:YihY/virulence factor BrkB family protein [Candidatus Tumulicola sp.]
MATPIGLLREAYAGWQRHNTAHLAAALAFYLAFSLAPLLVIAIAAAGLVIGPKAATQDVLGPVRDFLGTSGARFVTSLIANVNAPAPNIVAAAIGTIALIFGASGAFMQLYAALNIIFDAKRRPSRFSYILRVRLFSFLMVTLIGALLLASQIFDATLATAVKAHEPAWGVTRVVVFAASFVVITILFGSLFKFIPEASVAWRDALTGGMFTAALFLLGQWLLSMYVRYAAFHAVRGAAAAALIVMTWLYYLALIVFFGAEVTRAYAFGRKQAELPGIAAD